MQPNFRHRPSRKQRPLSSTHRISGVSPMVAVVGLSRPRLRRAQWSVCVGLSHRWMGFAWEVAAAGASWLLPLSGAGRVSRSWPGEGCFLGRPSIAPEAACRPERNRAVRLTPRAAVGGELGGSRGDVAPTSGLEAQPRGRNEEPGLHTPGSRFENIRTQSVCGCRRLCLPPRSSRSAPRCHASEACLAGVWALLNYMCASIIFNNCFIVVSGDRAAERAREQQGSCG